jgi:hypothetical protein
MLGVRRGKLSHPGNIGRRRTILLLGMPHYHPRHTSLMAVAQEKVLALVLALAWVQDERKDRTESMYTLWLPGTLADPLHRHTRMHTHADNSDASASYSQKNLQGQHGTAPKKLVELGNNTDSQSRLQVNGLRQGCSNLWL